LLKILAIGSSRVRISAKASIDTYSMSFDDRPFMREGNSPYRQSPLARATSRTLKLLSTGLCVESLRVTGTPYLEKVCQIAPR
jgi:hypothetical protein